MNNFAPYFFFANYSVLALLACLNFRLKSNYYFENYPFILSFCVIFLITLSGIIKNFRFEFIKSRLRPDYIDFFFFADLLYNIIAVFYSSRPRVSIEETVYTVSYFTLYLICRLIFSVSGLKQIEDGVKFIILISLAFAAKIYYFVFFHFQMISGDGRISYSTMHPNLLSSLILIFSSLLIYFIVKESLKQSKKISVIALLSTTLAAYALLIFMTSSRGGMLGFLIGALALAFAFSFRFKLNFKPFAIAGAAALIALASVFPGHFERIRGLFDGENLMSVGSRLHIWTAVARLFLKSPLIGFGPGTCNYEAIEYTNFTMIDAHNFLLEKLCNLGIIGAIIYLIPLAMVLRKAFRVIKDQSETFPSKIAMSGAVIFLVTALFTNSSFSPHFVLPLISFYLFTVIAMFQCMAAFEPATAEPVPAAAGANAKLLPAALIGASIIYFVFKALIVFLPLESYFETYPWHAILAIITASFACGFYLHPKEPPAAAEQNTISPARSYKPVLPALAAIVIINLYFCSAGFNYFVAEKANGLGIDAASRYAAHSGERYFDIALKYDPDNIAYLYNKSCIVFISEWINNKDFEKNPRIKTVIDLLTKCDEQYNLQPIFNSISVFLKNKYDGGDKKQLMNFNGPDAEKIKAFKETVLERPNNAFAEFSNLYHQNAYEAFTLQNQAILSEVMRIIDEEKTLAPQTKLARYFNYLSMTFRVALNIEIPWAEDILRHGIISALRSTEAASNYLPVKEFKTRSLQFVQQLEATSSIACVLPMVWKYSQNLELDGFIKKFFAFFGENNPLVSVAAHFLYQAPGAKERFKELDGPLFLYLEALDRFAGGNYSGVIQLQNELFNHKNLKQQIAALYSWTYYKMGRLDRAREFVLFSHINTLKLTSRHFTYKRDLLYSGNMMAAFYLPIQSYYNELLGFALLKMHSGNRRAVLQEIFNFLNTVVYKH